MKLVAFGGLVLSSCVLAGEFVQPDEAKQVVHSRIKRGYLGGVVRNLERECFEETCENFEEFGECAENT